MTGELYRDVIMEEHVRLLRRSMGVEFVFMDDNADSHRENIDIPGRRFAASQPPLTCLWERRRILFNEGCNIPQDQIDNLILSMLRYCTDCIASSGRHTMY
ncbi:transposable element Tcb1 transposase [Trichonephila clavipes]|nr:transposable element Tcb1 transposase [Trichonephila clavipes]